MADSVRLDKYVWAIRQFKTRSEATDACNGNKVQLNGAPAKPSKPVKVGDMLAIRKGSAQFTFKVLQLTETRMGAKLVPEFAENLTPESEMAKLRAPHETFFVQRDRGMGRPTKKDRRDMDTLWANFDPSELPDDYFDDDND
ncbi:MAG: RNA-binding S4 domain-containing protein [Bacteroidales bacterium]|nr:RNA-binding S4 domain-containing protein [Bacteroidales bacterium]